METAETRHSDIQSVTKSFDTGRGCLDSLLVRGSSSGRMTVQEIARDLNVGRLTVYTMLKQGIIPNVRLGRRWIITRHAFDQWERTCGMRSSAGLEPQPEVTVLN